MAKITPADVLQMASEGELETVRLSVSICKIDEEQQIVTGEVYAPFIIDSHGDMMEPKDVEQLSHSFMAKMLNRHIDIMHNNKPADAIAVESFIAKDHDGYNEGAWVLSTKILDKALWADIKQGKYNGYSMEAMVKKVPALVVIDVLPQAFGYVEANAGHDHVFYVEVDDDGRVTGGQTSFDDGHSHTLSAGTATDKTDGHSHRYFLP